MQNKPQERPRGSARFSITLSVECYPSISPHSTSARKGNFEGVLQNISNGGACMVTAQPLKIAEVLKVSFPIQHFVSTPRTLAEVKWTRSMPEGRFVSGLRFLL